MTINIHWREVISHALYEQAGMRAAFGRLRSAFRRPYAAGMVVAVSKCAALYAVWGIAVILVLSPTATLSQSASGSTASVLQDYDGAASFLEPECLATPDPLGLFRVDCHPEGHPSNDTLCQARGCCWDDTEPASGARSRAPRCFFSQNYGYYGNEPPRREGNAWRGLLHRHRTPSLFGRDVSTIAVLVEEQSDRRLRIKLYDPDHARAEVPFVNIPNPGAVPEDPLYQVTFTLDPFSIRVSRRSNNRTIFDSCQGGLVFSDQFLQLSARLASPHVYGLGEHLHLGFKHDMDWRTWAIHAAGKHPENKDARNMYGSFPVFLNTEEDGNANMVLLLNQHAMDVVLQPTPAVTFRTIGGVLDIYIFLGELDSPNGSSNQETCEAGEVCEDETPLGPPTPPVQAIQQYQQAVGLPVMPPYWALGFQLCRWGYGGSEGIRDVINRNRQIQIPYDVQWGDIDYMESAQSFTYDLETYPDLPEIVRDLHAHGQKYVAIHDPGIKIRNPGEYPAFDDGNRRDIWIKHSNGDVLEGKVWPGLTVFPDYTKEETRQWWAQHSVTFHKTLEFDGYWIDMNEPSNFIYGSTRGCEENRWNYPPYLPHITGEVLWDRSLCMDSEQALGRHYDIHSLYGHSMANATYYAGRQVFGDRRFLIVSRSTFVGSGQFAGKWLGDNAGTYWSMKASITGMLEFNMFGIPYVGANICGFFGDADEQLCQRWMQLGAFYPLSRNHNRNGTKSQDPASFSAAMVTSTRAVLETRYRLLPYLYTLFYLAHTAGSPVVRSLALEYPVDAVAMAVDAQFLWGPALMISPVLTNNTFMVRVYFPADRWFNFYTGEEVTSVTTWHSLPTRLDEIQLHSRGGYILPMQESAITTVYSRKKPMSLLVSLDAHQEARGLLYWDDGETLDAHKTKDCRTSRFHATKDMIVITTRDAEGHYDPDLVIDTVTVYGLSDVDAARVIKSTAGDSKPREVSDVDWDAEKKVLVVRGLSLSIAQSHYIAWA